MVAGHRCGSWPSDRRSSSFNAAGSVGPPPRATAPRSSSSSATSARSSLSNDKTSSASEALISGARHSDHEAERASRSSKSPRRSRKHAISRSRSSRAAVPVTAHRGRRVAGPRRNRLAPATHQEMHLARRRGASSRPGSNSPDSSSVSHRSPGHGRSSSGPRVTAIPQPISQDGSVGARGPLSARPPRRRGEIFARRTVSHPAASGIERSAGRVHLSDANVRNTPQCGKC